MEAYHKLTKNIAKVELAAVKHISENGIKRLEEFRIECSKLEDLTSTRIQDSESFRDMFEVLLEIKGPVLYIFEITSNYSSEEIIKKISEFKNGTNWKVTPAIKKHIPNSNFLYVGKVKKNFAGRIYQHLGYYAVRNTQALQLFHWAKELEIELKLTALEFEPDAAEFLGVLEKGFARELKPILGKHK